MRVVRRITYEVPDTPDGERRLREQMEKSLRPGVTFPWLTSITVEHLEGPIWFKGAVVTPDPERKEDER